MDLLTLRDTPPWDWPGDAGKTFAKVLKNRQAKPADRLLAADLAGDYTAINDDLAHLLLSVLQDNNEPDELRAHAVISFGAALESAMTEFDEESNSFDDDEMVPISVPVFLEIRNTLKRLYADQAIPKQVRRRILEASVRADEEWHADAIREAYASGDREWVLTAVFAMRFVPGFEAEVLEALKSTDPEIHREAVIAAGSKELDEAWSHVFPLARNAKTDKDLRIAAIGAIAEIRPQEARGLLWELTDSDDEEIAEAADDALSLMPSGDFDEDDDDEEEDDEDEDEDDEE